MVYYYLSQPRIPGCIKQLDGNPGAYLSGHYNFFGLNIQAICCDAHLGFLGFAVVEPGDLKYFLASCKRLLVEEQPLRNHLPDGTSI